MGNNNLPATIVDSIIKGEVPHSEIKVFGPYSVRQTQLIYDTRVQARNYHNIRFTNYDKLIQPSSLVRPIDFFIIPEMELPRLKKYIKDYIPYIGRQRFIIIERENSEHSVIFDWVKNEKLLRHSKVYSLNNFAYIKVKTNNQLKTDVIKDPEHLWI